MKQFNNKNPESKKSALELDNMLADKVKALQKDQAIKVGIFFLRAMKQSASNSLRGGELKLMPTLLAMVYQEEKAFNQYYSLLTNHVKESTRISELNFFLNELEHLGQATLSAKLVKEHHNSKETELRCQVL